jgi:hypothetical protein
MRKELQLYNLKSLKVVGINTNAHSKSVYLQMEYLATYCIEQRTKYVYNN